MVKSIVHGVIDPRTGKFHPSSTPSPTVGRGGSLGKGSDGNLSTAVATAEGLAMQTGKRVVIASRVVNDDGTATVVPHGAVKRGALRGAKPDPAGSNTMARTGTNKDA